MATNPETQALLEKAFQHVLAEQAKVLKHNHNIHLIEVATKLGDLASQTWDLLSQGFHKIRSTTHLTKYANEIEDQIDEISERNWTHINVSISAIYERVEESFKLQPIQERLRLKTALSVRNHFHNLRLLLLEQLLGARMLINNSDYGSEIERVWQQFFQQQLGPDFRVLQGGHILDYAGNDGKAQIDLLIVASDAHVITPSSSEGGKVNVLCDQVIAAIMTTSNLTTKKFREDWTKLEQISSLFKFTDELPHAFKPGKEQAWPLSYIISGQSVSLTELMSEWTMLADASPNSIFVPQFLLSLDSGYIYSGATSWPRPEFPNNYVKTNEVVSEQGLQAGLGIAWLLTQIRARAKLLQNKPFSTITRFTRLLDNAALKSATPPTWSPRFDVFGSNRPVEGAFHWGGHLRWLHNNLLAGCLRIIRPNPSAADFLYKSDIPIDPSTIDWSERHRYFRWFKHGVTISTNGYIAFEEYLQKDSDVFEMRYAVFELSSGKEVAFLGIPTPSSDTIVLSELNSLPTISSAQTN